MFNKEYSPQNSSHNSTLRLHHALQDYKKKEQDKYTLSNKIMVLRQQSETNRKKAMVIQNHISKINQIKLDYKRNKNYMSQTINVEKENYNKKINRQKRKVQASKENVGFMRDLIVYERQQEYRKLKEKEKINQMRITQNFKKSLHEKRQRSLQIKLKEEESRLVRTIFMEKKRLKAHRDSQCDLVSLERGLLKNNRQIMKMKQLQNKMMRQLSNSRQSLSKSKLTLRKVMH